MLVRSTFHPVILNARQRLADGRSKLRSQHESGSLGLQVCTRLTDLVDSVLRDIYQVCQEELSLTDLQSEIALVAHGGYGRRDLAPYSDVDLMLLHHPSVSERLVPLARRLSQNVVDAGLQLGFALRTPSQALRLAWQDPQVFTSLTESRLLVGSDALFTRFMASFRSGSNRRSERLMREVEKARFDEQQKFGETVFLLQPNIKRSRGGLRDIHLLRWVAFCCFGETDPDQLLERGYLSEEDHHVLRRAYHYLLRIRNEMHFEAGKSQDLLDRSWQLKLAPWYGCEGSEGVLPVEQFMQEYFDITSDLYYTVSHFVENQKVRSPIVRWFAQAFSWPVTKDFRLGLRSIWANKGGLKRLQDPADVLELMDISNRYRRPIENTTWRAIRSSMIGRKPGEDVGPEVIQRFLSLMSRPGRLGKLLRRLHELRVLEQIIPAFRHARCLLQFNEYHKYTVDAHCIKAVECVTEFERSDDLVGKVYRQLKQKQVLHLALLIHDLGKGFIEDHSEVGRRIAIETGERLNLEESQRELLTFLVHKHLNLANIAFRYDLSSSDTIVRFASEVGSSEQLQMLFVLTCADIAAVGPDVLNQWKLDLLTQLYQRTESQFRDENPDERFQQELRDRRAQVTRLIPTGPERSWWLEQVQGLPAAYLLRSTPSHVIHELGQLRRLEKEPAIAWGRYIPQQDATEYTIAVRQTGAPIGAFHRITGALSSLGLQILEAEIHTQPGQIAWDRFYVQDTEYSSAPPESRLNRVSARIVEALDPKSSTPPSFRRVWKPGGKAATATLNFQPTQVRFDNSTSDAYTVISVFAYDRLGLLYDIAQVLFQMELVLQFAKISTHLDQVVDVFYVNDLQGRKILEPTRLYTIRQRLLKAIEP